MTPRQEEILRKREFWFSHIESCADSGLPQSEYCREHGLIYHRFIYWKIRWREALSSAPGPTFVPVPVQRPGFSSFSGSNNSFPSSLRLTVRNGYQIEVGDAFRSETLARLLELLERV